MRKLVLAAAVALPAIAASLPAAAEGFGPVHVAVNHHFMVYPDAKAAFDEKGGRFDEGAARALAEWLRGR